MCLDAVHKNTSARYSHSAAFIAAISVRLSTNLALKVLMNRHTILPLASHRMMNMFDVDHSCISPLVHDCTFVTRLAILSTVVMSRKTKQILGA